MKLLILLLVSLSANSASKLNLLECALHKTEVEVADCVAQWEERRSFTSNEASSAVQPDLNSAAQDSVSAPPQSRPTKL